MSLVSIISVFHCTLIINSARSFHNFENVEWFVQHWMICNYDAECILTTLNDLYFVEWFVLSWIICICNVECFFDYMERFALLLNDLDGSMKLPPKKYHPENRLRIFSPMKISTMNIAPSENPPSGNSSGNQCFETNEKTDYL